jgi:hypothetical protein
MAAEGGKTIFSRKYLDNRGPVCSGLTVATRSLLIKRGKFLP